MTLFSHCFHNVHVFLTKLRCVKWLWFIFLNPLLYAQAQSVSVLLSLGHKNRIEELLKRESLEWLDVFSDLHIRQHTFCIGFQYYFQQHCSKPLRGDSVIMKLISIHCISFIP